MPTPTYDLIASNVLGSNTASVTFSSIPSTYRDLILVINSKVSSTSAIQLKINSDTGANYSYVVLAGDGSGGQTDHGTNQTTGFITNYAGATSTDETVFISHFMDYSATDKHKTYLTRGNQATGAVTLWCGRWGSTSAITSLELYLPSTRTFTSGGTFYLYGIAS